MDKRIPRNHPEIAALYTDLYWEAGPPFVTAIFLAASVIWVCASMGFTTWVLAPTILIYFQVRMGIQSYRDFLERRARQEEWLRKLDLEDPDEWRAFEARIYEGIKGDKS